LTKLHSPKFQMRHVVLYARSFLPPLPPRNLDKVACRPTNTMVPVQPAQPLYTMRQHPTALTFYYPAPVGCKPLPIICQCLRLQTIGHLNFPPQLCPPYQAYLSAEHKTPGRPPHACNCQCNQVTSNKMQQWI
jgi:hypothetical protein